MYRLALIPFLLAAAMAGSGCADDFDPYEDVRTPRLLAIAADRPFLSPGDSAVVSALATETATYEWSWCPLVSGSDTGYSCLVTQPELQAAVDEILGEGQVTVPDFALGTGETAQLDHSVPPEVWRGFCDVLQSGTLPGPVEFPSCDEYFDVSIRVEVTMGDAFIVGAREVRLLYDAADPLNANPAITSAIAVDPDSGDEIALHETDVPTLRRGVEYELRLDIAADQAEIYERVPVEGGPAETVDENLRISWFHQGGELDRAATGSNDTTPLSEILANEWLTPTVEERADKGARLFFVLRDDRGGTSWLVRAVEFDE